jgi:YYY domain-containing protein
MFEHLLSWYLTLQIFALAGFPLAFVWLRGLRSRGYAAAKAFGLLFSGILLWWGGITHLWGVTGGAALAAALLLLGVGLWKMRGHWHALADWWRSERTFIRVTEVLFLVALVAWALVRSTQPQIATAGGEKWMEIGFLNAILRSPSLPPHDPWLSGFAISYYYLGYLLLGMLTHVAALPATIAFNLGNAAWFALTAVAAYGLVYDLLDQRRPWGALAAPLLLLVTGNGTALLQILHQRGLFSAWFWKWLDIRTINTAPPSPGSWTAPQTFDWWRASRTLHDYAPISTVQNPVDQEVIDEFPAFSFILGDMHPHLLGLPFVLLAIALALNLWRRRESLPMPPALRPLLNWPDGWRAYGQALLARVPHWIGHALVLGALGFLNTWDFPIYWALVVGVYVLATYRRNEVSLFEHILSCVPEAGLLGVLSILCYLPFWIGLRSQAGGIMPNIFNATHPAQFVVMFAPFVIPITALLVQVARRTQTQALKVLGWTGTVLLVISLITLVLGVIMGAPYVRAVLRGEQIMGVDVDLAVVTQALYARLLNPWTALTLLIGVVTAVHTLLQHGEKVTAEGLTFPLLMALLGLGLTLTPEFIFLKDVFSTRMNTIFKFYYQAWVLWSLVSAWWLVKTAAARTLSGGKQLLLILTGVAIAAGLLYPIYAIPARAAQNRTFYGTRGTGTLDGTLWLTESHPEDWAAVRWLNANVDGRPVILETPGAQHKAYVYEGRISALTGLPTVLGWAGHERQWRGTYDEQAQREQAIETLFTTVDPARARELLARYDVRYVYVGPLERTRYPEEGLRKFDALFPTVYNQAGVKIYHVTGVTGAASE